MLALPATFPTVAAGTPAATTTVPVTVTNTGDQPLTITNVTVQPWQGVQTDPVDAGAAQDFAIVANNCLGGPIPAGAPAVPPTGTTPGSPAVPRGTCTVTVGFKPTRTNWTSVARLQFTSNSDDATERVLLVGRSAGGANSTDVPVGGEVGGGVEGSLGLTIPAGPWSFGTFIPGLARNYDLNLGAQVTSTAGNAALSVADNSTNAPGRLVNGSFALATPLALRAPSPAVPNPAYVPMPTTTGTPVAIRSWTGPVTNDGVQIGLRQSIGANEPLRSGSYSKNLTFTLQSATP